MLTNLGLKSRSLLVTSSNAKLSTGLVQKYFYRWRVSPEPSVVARGGLMDLFTHQEAEHLCSVFILRIKFHHLFEIDLCLFVIVVFHIGPSQMI